MFQRGVKGAKKNKTPERKFATTGYRNRNHQVFGPTCSPLSHPGGERDRLVVWCLTPFSKVFQTASAPIYSRTSLARTSLSRTYPYVEVFSRSRSHCSLFQCNSTCIRRIYISKFIHTSNEFQSPITILERIQTSLPRS